MNQALLAETAKRLVVKGKGILAADESLDTIQKRFDAINLESTEQNRQKYRELLFTTPEIEKYISGVILFNETVWQETAEGKLLTDILNERGIIPGIKVDEGKYPAPGSEEEYLTKGLDTLPERLEKYAETNLKFAKWRAVFTIKDNLPSEEITLENARRLAEYAFECQEFDLVPIVEPEVLMDGSHSIERCEEVTIDVLTQVFSELERRGVFLPGMLLKPNLIVSGKDNEQTSDAYQVSTKTIRVLTKCVPAEVPGIVFLSGGLTPVESTLYLNELNKKNKDLPWELSFSFGRALQEPVLKTWQGKAENIKAAQKAFLHRARLNSFARDGAYNREMEAEDEQNQ
ncbi:fructose-bisphosphate aldolase [Candidatus Woesebacteria bacterium RIFOXYB1_FULL_38_16]|uniref:Probable fructose-bisphosphate aldolase class 1 n=1 Tax=Candidatus Woesebacteria bacterium RIFOXYB1_FULL_38_16 TaxID=1802538 RepID=A0A1F8CTT8_9BACT|nr:MAG: fructose-bisphosphate aldolase [Candidatus Woesebacteria bacterium RIFOXYB1_FULL_38_16]